MLRDRQRRIALRAGLASAVVIVGCTGFLISDHVRALRAAPADQQEVAALEQRVKTDPQVAPALHQERERQTEAALRREGRNRGMAWLLLLAGGVFVACGKWYVSQRPQPLPTLDELVAERFAAPPGAHGRPRQTPRPLAPADPAQIDLSFVDQLVARVGRSRELSIPILQAIQTHYRYLPDEALRRVCELTEITAAQVAGTSSFYAQFRRSPVGRHVVRVCHGTACHVAGADRITRELRRHLEIPVDQDTDPRRLFTIDRVACLGCCSLAPVMMIDDDTAGRLTPASARQTLDGLVPTS